MSLDASHAGLRERLSALLFESGRIDEAVEEAHAAAALASRQGESSPTRLLQALRRAPDAAEVRARLSRRLAGEDRLETRFALAASYDTDHLLREAREGYEHVIERDPRHAHALVYLANLRLGADRGRCRSCDESFERWPEVLDREEGERLLLRALEIDGGRDESLLRTSVALAILHGLGVPVARSLESLLVREPAGPVATRLRASLDRLQQAGAGR